MFKRRILPFSAQNYLTLQPRYADIYSLHVLFRLCFPPFCSTAYFFLLCLPIFSFLFPISHKNVVFLFSYFSVHTSPHLSRYTVRETYQKLFCYAIIFSIMQVSSCGLPGHTGLHQPQTRRNNIFGTKMAKHMVPLNWPDLCAGLMTGSLCW